MFFKNKKNGSILFVSLVMTGVFMLMVTGTISMGLLQQKINMIKVANAQAIYIAEAGINYYRWVLYHDKNEFCNKETCIDAPNYGPYGPYPYSDQSGNILGHYELYITPPSLDTNSIITIKSVGWVDKYPNIKRTIEVKCGITSWSSFAVLSNSDVRFGEGTEIWGPIYSNGGIRFDGIAHNIISSAVLDYKDPDHEGENEFGVHTHVFPVDPYPDGNNPPQNLPNRTDVFMGGRSFPDPVISFDLLDNYINDTLETAEDGGLILDSSGVEGYHITFLPNELMRIRKVNSVTSPCSVCIETGCTRWNKQGKCIQTGCTEYNTTPTYGINNESNYMDNISIPSNGIIFVKDNVWVDGKIKNNRVTILAFKEPLSGNNTDIIINDDLLYTNYDGQDVIGLIAQRNITVGFYSKNNLEIDAAMIAKNGRVGRDYYYSACGSQANKNILTLKGSMATKERYGFAYTDNSGYQIRNIIFDNNLQSVPPPHFPTTGEYTFISWEEK